MLRREEQFAILLAVPEDAPFGQFHFLVALPGLALGQEGGVQREADLLPAHDAYAYLWFGGIVGRRLLLFLGGLLDTVDNTLEHLSRKCALPQQGQGLVGRDALIVLASGHDEQSRHVECTGAHEQLLLPFFVIAVRAVLRPWYDYRDKLIALSPAHDVHHGFRLVGGQG